MLWPVMPEDAKRSTRQRGDNLREHYDIGLMTMMYNRAVLIKWCLTLKTIRRSCSDRPMIFSF